MFKKKSNIFKKILIALFIGCLGLASVAGITFSSINIAKKTNLSSDFDQGVGYSLKFNLVDENNQKLYDVITQNNQQSYILKNESSILNKLSNTANIVASQLQSLGLTNISVSSGIGSYSYHDNSSTGEQIIPIGYVNMNFENSKAVFNLNEDDNSYDFSNDAKINAAIGISNRYELETVKNIYTPYSYTSIPNTFRNDTNSSIIANKDGVSLNKDYFAVSDSRNINDNIEAFRDNDGIIDNNAVQLVQKDYYYLAPFIYQKFNYDKIEEDSSTYISSREGEDNDDNNNDDNEDNNKPSPKDQFQTQYTWLLWNNKAGFLNYINRLVLLSYYNIYANNINRYSIASDKVDKPLYNVGTPTSDYRTNTNTVDTNLRKQINTYLDSLSEIEKSIVKFFTSVGTGFPDFVTEKTLMGFLYEFYNSEYNTNNSVGKYGDFSINANNHSKSEINGWGFLETDNNDLSSLLSKYLIAKYDYTNYAQFFQDPNPDEKKDENDENNNDEPIYYTTQKFKLTNQASSLKTFINDLKNNQYDFPLLDIGNKSILDAMYNANTSLRNNLQNDIINNVFGSHASGIFKDNPEYQKRLKEISKNFSTKNIFGDIVKTRERYIKPTFYDFPIFNILLIVLASIILLVGIIVSILYRIPGAISFLFSALTFTGSLAFFNLFGYTFSFFSFAGLIFGTFLTFITPFYLFRNFKKEIKEGSSIYGAYIKSMKKYWKLSLDIHVISLLASFSFLFFGKNQIVEFGALLTISTFLSLILSGIIFFVSISFIVSMFNSPRYWLFMNKGLFKDMRLIGAELNTSLNEANKLQHKQNWISFFFVHNYYSKYRIFLSLVLAIICLAGVILLFVINPGSSRDFAGGYILKIVNFDIISNNVDLNLIPGYLGNGYVYDNVLYAPISGINNDEILSWIKQITNTENYTDILNSYSICEHSSYIPSQTIDNALKCFGISIGFIACWVLISINWVAVIPMIITQLFIFIISFGWIGIIRAEFNIDEICIIALVYLVGTVFAIGLLSSIKISWNRKNKLSYQELKVLTNSILNKVAPNYNYYLAIYFGFAILSAIFTANVLLAIAFAVLAINIMLIWVSVPYVLINLWHLFIMFKNIYVKELVQSSSNKMLEKSMNFDDVDEQIVKGLNF